MMKEEDKAESNKALAWWVGLVVRSATALHIMHNTWLRLSKYYALVVMTLCSSSDGED